MVKWLLAGLFLLALGSAAPAQLNGCPAGFCGPTAVGAAAAPTHSTGTCAQSNVWFKRVVGLSAKEASAYDVLICGLVNDGIINGPLSGASSCGPILDALYIFATNNTATANQNICGTSYLLINDQGVPILTRDVGYISNGGCLATNFIPIATGSNMQLTSAHFGIYILSSRTVDSLTAVLGVSDVNNDTFQFFPLYGGGKMDADVNTAGFDTQVNPTGNIQGSWIASRTTGSLTTTYHNGSSIGTTSTASSAFSPFQTLYLLGRDFVNSCNVPDAAQVSAAWFGVGINATQAGLIQNRINNYMKAFSINVY